MAGAIFGAADHVSSVLVPFGATAGDGWRIFGISGSVLAPDLRTLLLLCDRGAIYGATVEFDGLRLVNVSFHQRTEITGRDQLGVPMDMDVEGLAMDNSTGELLLSSEPSHLFRLPVSWRHFIAGNGTAVEAQWLPQQPTAVVEQNELPNQGLEALTATVNHTFVAGLEGPLVKDDSLLRRILEVDQTGRLLWSGFILMDNVPSPPLLLSELAAVQLPGYEGGPYFLGLERRWSRVMGNDIRLYLLNLAGASDVSNCSAICDGACPFQGEQQCYLEDLQAIQKHLLFQWTASHSLGGLQVDNYEAMTVIAPEALGYENAEALGGVAVLLVNDNNDNPRQIGTQFVLLRLPYAVNGKDEEEPQTWPMVMLVLTIIACCLCFMLLRRACSLRSRRAVPVRHQRFQDHEDEGPNKLGRPDDAV